MIANVIDHRKHPYRWRLITAIAEATWHDNSVAGADLAVRVPDELDVPYDSMEATSLTDAIAWAQSMPCEVTLFLYDLGDGIGPAG